MQLTDIEHALAADDRDQVAGGVVADGRLVRRVESVGARRYEVASGARDTAPLTWSAS